MPHSVMAATALPREGGATRERPRHCFLCLPHGATLGLRGGPPSPTAALLSMDVTTPHPDFAIAHPQLKEMAQTGPCTERSIKFKAATP